MNQLVAAIRRFVSEEEGVTAIEYGLIAALIAVVIITAITLVGEGLRDVFLRIADCLTEPQGPLCNP